MQFKFTFLKDIKWPEFGAFLKNCRKQNNIKQVEVARKLETTSTAIARLESGGGAAGHSPTLKTLQKYFRAIGYGFSIVVEKREDSREDEPSNKV